MGINMQVTRRLLALAVALGALSQPWVAVAASNTAATGPAPPTKLTAKKIHSAAAKPARAGQAKKAGRPAAVAKLGKARASKKGIRPSATASAQKKPLRRPAAAKHASARPATKVASGRHAGKSLLAKKRVHRSVKARKQLR